MQPRNEKYRLRYSQDIEDFHGYRHQRRLVLLISVNEMRESRKQIAESKG